MRIIIILFLTGLFIQNVYSQKIKIVEASETIDKVSKSGLYTVVDLDSKNVEKAWERHLKTFGKLESSKGILIVPVAKISEISSQNCVVNSKVQSTSNGAKIWWSIDMGNAYATPESNNRAYKAAEKILYDFVVNCYKEDVNEQIKDAEKALSTASKNQEKEMKEGDQLVKNVERNKQQKEKLQQALEENAKELEQLKRDIEQNKVDQKSASENVEKMKKAVEVVKEKLSHIE